MIDDLAILVVPAFSTLGNAAFRLRHQVFIGEQGVPPEEENDAYDLTATHMVAVSKGEVIGTLRLVVSPEHVKIGRVAVDRAMRGQGVAGKMISHAMVIAADMAGGRFYLTAQIDAARLYERFGFKAFGEEFMDAGIRHIAMKNY